MNHGEPHSEIGLCTLDNGRTFEGLSQNRPVSVILYRYDSRTYYDTSDISSADYHTGFCPATEITRNSTSTVMIYRRRIRAYTAVALLAKNCHCPI